MPRLAAMSEPPINVSAAGMSSVSAQLIATGARHARKRPIASETGRMGRLHSRRSTWFFRSEA